MVIDAARAGELRPRDFAVLLLASGELSPRKRARDQQADLAGLELKRRILVTVADRDPDPPQLESHLCRVIAELGTPTGPMRAIAMSFLEEWRMALASPEWLAHLIGEAAQFSSREEAHGRSVSP